MCYSGETYAYFNDCSECAVANDLDKYTNGKAESRENLNL